MVLGLIVLREELNLSRLACAINPLNDDIVTLVPSFLTAFYVPCKIPLTLYINLSQNSFWWNMTLCNVVCEDVPRLLSGE